MKTYKQFKIEPKETAPVVVAVAEKCCSESYSIPIQRVDVSLHTKEQRDSIPTAHRTPCEVWSRVMGYHRPVASWNVGKKAEHRDRVPFDEPVL